MKWVSRAITEPNVVTLVVVIICVWTLMESLQGVLGYDPDNLLIALLAVFIASTGLTVVLRWLAEAEVRGSVEWMPGDPVPKDEDFAKVLDRLDQHYDILPDSVGGIRPLWTRRPEGIALVYDRLTDAANILEDINEAAVLAAERSKS